MILIVLTLFQFFVFSSQLNVSNETVIDKITLDLQVKNLTTIDWKQLNVTSDVLKDVKNLFLNNNSITDIQPSTFDGMTSLEVLNLGWNNITHLNRHVFDGLVNLSRLYLNNNRILLLKNSTFNQLKNLRILKLHYNEMAQMDSDQFVGLELKELYLAFNNLTSISNLTSNKKMSVESSIMRLINSNASITVDIANNTSNYSTNETDIIKINDTISITESESQNKTVNGSSSALANLEKITICFNQLKEIKANDFNGLVNLKYMRILFNKISSIEENSFADLVNLNYLNLRGNKFQTIDRNMFYGLNKLETLILSRNLIEKVDKDSWEQSGQQSSSEAWAHE